MINKIKFILGTSKTGYAYSNSWSLLEIGLPLDLLRRLRIVVDYSVLPWNCLQSHERALN